MAPSQHCLSHMVKREVSGRRFDSDDEGFTAVNHFLKIQDADFSSKEIHVLHGCWIKRVNAGGDTAEK